MLLVSFTENNRTRIGVLDRGRSEIVDLASVAPDMLAFIAAGETGLAAARAALASGNGRLPLAHAKLLAPIPRPARNILCVGKNYRDHALEIAAVIDPGKDPVPESPIIFTKWPSSVIGPGVPIPAHLDPTASADYEGELAVIIGRGGRGIRRGDAMRHVFGYTIVNDVTSRRLQARHKQWFLGKSVDGFCPMGPVIITVDEVTDVGALRIQTRVNDELRQDGGVADLIFDIPTLIETLSLTMTLEPGDIIATGTPAGVGMGFKPPKFLHKGDLVAVTIEPIGTLINPVE
ncbi:MAG: fumarylacetoacetate hydrolase family protein [Gammaproteobacteria bacterium]|nr:fumarylacetoacetate hydrolase family protein [Gammaproteobacteria bacterium]